MKYFTNSFVDWTFADLMQSLCHQAGHDAVKELETAVFHSMGHTPVMITNLGRTALILGLKALGIPPGSGVLLPAITCTTVIRSVLRAGYTPIITDVGDDLHITPDAIAPESLANAKAIIVPHLYGMASPICQLVHWAADRRLRVIDDAAQAAGILLDGKPLGTFGDIGILSFGPFKNIACTRGGALISSDRALISTSREWLQEAETARDALRRILGGVLKRHFRRSILRCKSGIAALKRTGKAPGSNMSEDQQSEFEGDCLAGLNALEAATVKTLFSRAQSIIESRRKTADEIRQIIQGHIGLEILGPADTPYTRIPIRLKGRLTPDEAVHCFRDMRIEAIKIYKPLPLYASFAEYALQPVPNSLRLWNSTILLPNPIRSHVSHVMRQLRPALDMLQSKASSPDLAIQ